MNAEALDLWRDVKEKMIRLGITLKSIRDDRLYRELDAETFEAYLEERGIAQSTAYAYIEIVEAFAPFVLPSCENLEAHMPRVEDDVALMAWHAGEPCEPVVTLADVAALGVTRARAIMPLVRGADPETVREHVAAARTAATTLDVREYAAERLQARRDPLRDYLEDVRRAITSAASRLPIQSQDAPDLLDEIVARAMAARKRLDEGSAR